MNCDNQCCENKHDHHCYDGGKYGINVNTLVHTNELLLVEQAAELVPVDMRKPGTKITFWTYSGWETWQFVSKDVKEWVLPEHWKQESVYGMDNINDLQNQIDSIQIGGWAISQEFGDDEHIGISQKKLTEEFNKTATLDSNGKVPSYQLPSYVDDVVEGYFYNSAFYADENHTQLLEAETGKIYVDAPTEVSYRYSGSVYVAISNPYYPDEEDLTVDNDKIKFKDKAYSAASYSGLGRKYLRKNMVNGVNTLTQAMFSAANTIYVIQYDYDLNGATIDIPENCVLKFEGGSMQNGSLACDNTAFQFTGEKNDALINVLLSGIFQYSSSLYKHNSLESIFAFNNELNNPFFSTSDGWEIENCSVTDKLNISGKGWASQQISLLSGHRYVAVCYGKINSVSHIIRDSSTSFYGRYGLGYQIKDATPVNGQYNFNIDFVGNREVSDYVPIIHVFDVANNANATIKFGEIYDGNGTITGTILHAGVYDVTNIVNGVPNYVVLFKSYKNWIERELEIYSTITETQYPDSIADLAFIEEMDNKAKCSYMNHSVFGTPSGLFANGDKYNDCKSYRTIIEPSEIQEGKMLRRDGSVADNYNTTVYTYRGLNPNNRYFINNVYIPFPYLVAVIYFYNDDDSVSFTYNDYICASSYYVHYDVVTPIRYSINKEELLNIPKNCTKIRVMTRTGNVPELTCLSMCTIDSYSVEINANSEYDEFRCKSTILSAKDICILNGLAAADRKAQEVWNVQKSTATIYNTGDISYRTRTVQMARTDDWYNDKYFVMFGKGGSYRSRSTPSGTEYKDIGLASCVIDRSNGRWFSVCVARYDYLPNYNIVDIGGVPTEVTDEVLKSDYPEIYAKKWLNTNPTRIQDQLIGWYQQKEGYNMYGDPSTENSYTFDPETSIDWDCCAVCEIFPDMPFVYNEVDGAYRSGDTIYQTTLEKRYSIVRGKEINMAMHPMSITKTMTTLVAMEYLNLSDFIEYREGDIVSGSGSTFDNNAYFSLRDAILQLMANSDNTIATDICRHVGHKILEARYGK